jgi:thioredoxin-like negative regulator of GroEL
MADPYKVLQVSPSASDEEIKAAYREMVRKYHPDNYNGNPLSDLANEKMQEINEAYDQITAMRQNGNAGGNANGSAGGAYRAGGSQFADIRRLIASRRVTEAEELLDGVPENRRDAEWHFLKGTVQQLRGWLDDAYRNYAAACDMDPANPEYKNAFSQINWQRQHARPYGGAYGGGYGQPAHAGGCSICDICATLYCMDCMCDCFRGGC